MIRRYKPLKRGKKSFDSKPRAKLSSQRKNPSPVLQERKRLYREAKELKIQQVAVEQGMHYLNFDPTYIHCEVPGCKRQFSDYHHTHGRHGTDLFDITRAKLVCRSCHNQIHHDPAWARSIGFLKPKA